MRLETVCNFIRDGSQVYGKVKKEIILLKPTV